MTNTTDSKAAAVAERGAHVAPAGASSKKGATRTKKAPTARRNAKGAKPRASAPKKEAKEAKAPREGTKKAKILALLERKEGATLAQMMKATGWQKHSVRGFLSGALGKQMGLTIANAKAEDGERVYKLGK